MEEILLSILCGDEAEAAVGNDLLYGTSHSGVSNFLLRQNRRSASVREGMTTTSDTPRYSRRCHNHTLSGRSANFPIDPAMFGGLPEWPAGPGAVEASPGSSQGAPTPLQRPPNHHNAGVGFISRGFRGRPRDQDRGARMPPGQYEVRDFPVL